MLEPLRPLNAHEAEIFAALKKGETAAAIKKRLASKMGGPGRITYCLNALRGLGLYNGHLDALTARGRDTESGWRPQPTTTTTQTQATTTPDPADDDE